MNLLNSVTKKKQWFLPLKGMLRSSIPFKRWSAASSFFDNKRLMSNEPYVVIVFAIIDKGIFGSCFSRHVLLCSRGVIIGLKSAENDINPHYFLHFWHKVSINFNHHHHHHHHYTTIPFLTLFSSHSGWLWNEMIPRKRKKESFDLNLCI